MDIDYTVQIWREGGQFVAHAMPLDVASSGATPQAARSALEEVVKFFIQTAEQHGTRVEVLEDSSYERAGAQWSFCPARLKTG